MNDSEHDGLTGLKNRQALQSCRFIAIASFMTKPKRELRREAPQLSFGFNVLTYLAMAIVRNFESA